MNIKGILVKIITTLSLLFIIHTTVEAASFSATASKTTVTVGDTFSITVNASGASGMYTVSTDSSIVSVTSGKLSDFLDDASATITFKAEATGKVTITAQATDMTDNNDDKIAVKGSYPFTITVNEKSTNTTPNPTQNPNLNQNTNNNTTNPNTNNNTSTTKPEENKPKEVTFSNTSGTVYAVQSTNLRSSATTKGNNVMRSLPAGTEMTVTAKSNSEVDGYYWYKVSVNGTTGYVATSLVTNTKPTETELPTLKSLSVNPGNYSPAFSKDKTTYNLSVEDDVQQVTVKATPESGATAKITCNGTTCANGVIPINEGLNTVKITVTKDGADNTYTLYIRKSIKEDENGNISDDEKNNVDLYLKSLEITGFTISPEFDSKVYSYTVVIPADDERTSLDIKAVANIENAKVEIVDNENLEYGENIITIIVTSEEENATRIYQLVVDKQKTATTEASNGNNIVGKTKNIVASNKVPVLIICTLIIIAVICIILIIKFGRKEDDFDSQLEEEVNKIDMLDTEISEEVYNNQYLNELIKRENKSEKDSDYEEDMLSETTDDKRGKHF